MFCSKKTVKQNSIPRGVIFISFFVDNDVDFDSKNLLI